MTRDEFQDQIDIGDILKDKYKPLLYEFLGYNISCEYMGKFRVCERCKGYFILKKLYDGKIFDEKCCTSNGHVRLRLHKKKIVFEEFITEEEFSI